MCGVAGLLQLKGDPASPKVVQAMTRALAHRGPDGEGVWCDGPIGLGHRRLAILDLSAANAQPMVSADGRFVLSYNGEVYNFAALRLDLERCGHRFSTPGDTEVVLTALVQWGVSALTRFNGMFALALWDRREQRLLLARDRYGVKPLYYTRVAETLLFGSEIKALLAHPSCSAEMDTDGLVEYFTFQNFFTDRTLFRGIRILPAGTWIEVKWGQDPPPPQRYWDFCFAEPEIARPAAEYIEELDAGFDQAVQRQLVADVDVGAYLSGGMDSGAITAVASRYIPFMRTFTCGFDLTSASGIELNFDERPAAERMSYLFRTEHYEMVLKAGDMERVMPSLTRHLEEPRVGQSYPNYYAAHLASKFVKVALAGTGGDELFGGYPWRYYRAVTNDFSTYVDAYYDYWQRLVPETMHPAFFLPISRQAGQVSPREIFRNAFGAHAAPILRPEDCINQSLYLEAKTFLHGLLVVEDKLSMAHGLECRVPFLDNDLVDLAQRLPVSLKVGDLQQVVKLNENDPGHKSARYFQRTNDGKLALRQLMARHLPADIVGREKQGFSAPDASWFRGESIDYVRRLLTGRDCLLYQFIDRKTCLDLINDHLEGRQNRRLLIWSLLNVECWCKEFLT